MWKLCAHDCFNIILCIIGISTHWLRKIYSWIRGDKYKDVSYGKVFIKKYYFIIKNGI